MGRVDGSMREVVVGVVVMICSGCGNEVHVCLEVRSGSHLQHQLPVFIHFFVITNVYQLHDIVHIMDSSHLSAHDHSDIHVESIDLAP